MRKFSTAAHGASPGAVRHLGRPSTGPYPRYRVLADSIEISGDRHERGDIIHLGPVLSGLYMAAGVIKRADGVVPTATPARAR